MKLYYYVNKKVIFVRTEFWHLVCTFPQFSIKKVSCFIELFDKRDVIK